MKVKTSYKFGMRAIKTALATSIAIAICQFLNVTNPSFAGVEAIICLKPNVYDSLQMAINRIIATLIGALIGVIFVQIGLQNPLGIFLGISLIIYFCNIFGFLNSIVLGCIVFLMIILYNNPDMTFYEYTLDRLLISFIGQGVGFFTNYFLAPPKVKVMLYKLYNKTYNDCIVNFEKILKSEKVDNNILVSDINQLNSQVGQLKANQKIRIRENITVSDIHNINSQFYLLISLLNEMSENEYIPFIDNDLREKIKKLLRLDHIEYTNDSKSTYYKVFNYDLNKILILFDKIYNNVEKLK